MFFYGSLMDPEVIETIAKLQSPAQVRTATITGFRVKMWGIYPTLIPDEHGKVDGVVWEVTSEDRFDRLAAYETDAYCCTVCDAVLEDGTVLEGCRTFCWAGDLDSGDLEDGKFDLERYRRYFKSSVVRPRQAGKN